MKYYKNLETGSIYRTEEIKFSDGTPSLRLQRWSWDFQNWNGHIHDHEKTRKQLNDGIVIIEIPKEEAYQKIN